MSQVKFYNKDLYGMKRIFSQEFPLLSGYQSDMKSDLKKIHKSNSHCWIVRLYTSSTKDTEGYMKSEEILLKKDNL